jgi:hypothetical protein
MNQKFIITALVACAATNVIVCYQIRSIPEEIAIAVKAYFPDSVKVPEIQTARVEQLGNLVYLDGRVAHTSFRIRDHYSYNTSFPSEIWNGYLTAVKGSKGEDFYVWTQEPYAEQEADFRRRVDGWFIAQGHSFWGKEPDLQKKAPQMLIPVTAKQWCNSEFVK